MAEIPFLTILEAGSPRSDAGRVGSFWASLAGLWMAGRLLPVPSLDLPSGGLCPNRLSLKGQRRFGLGTILVLGTLFSK